VLRVREARRTLLERALGDGGRIRSECAQPPSTCARAAAFDTERAGSPTARLEITLIQPSTDPSRKRERCEVSGK
jgi:hypothetical protein